jgi:putative flippase GtrA
VKAVARQFVSFTGVGLIGLAVDAGVFTLLTAAFAWSTAPARAASVSGMVLLTWALNRAVTFAQHRSPRRGAEFLRYAVVQALGLALNVGVFWLCLRYSAALRAVPLVPLVLGAAAGFAFNFSVMRALVFRSAPAPGG